MSVSSNSSPGHECTGHRSLPPVIPQFSANLLPQVPRACCWVARWLCPAPLVPKLSKLPPDPVGRRSPYLTWRSRLPKHYLTPKPRFFSLTFKVLLWSGSNLLLQAYPCLVTWTQIFYSLLFQWFESMYLEIHSFIILKFCGSPFWYSACSLNRFSFFGYF